MRTTHTLLTAAQPWLQRLARHIPAPLAAVPLSIGWRLGQWVRALPIPDELQGQVFEIHVRDGDLRLRFTYQGQHLQPAWSGTPALKLSANAADFLRMAAGDMDADTLFFQRKLAIEGDTELGLVVKNWLDAVERPPQLVAWIHAIVP